MPDSMLSTGVESSIGPDLGEDHVIIILNPYEGSS